MKISFCIGFVVAVIVRIVGITGMKWLSIKVALFCAEQSDLFCPGKRHSKWAAFARLFRLISICADAYTNARNERTTSKSIWFLFILLFFWKIQFIF